jgi:anti-sigma regulatory factor (Ser/Thr protein kinase)
LADELPDTVDAVLGVSRADRQHERLLECLARSEATFLLENDSALVYPLVDHLQQIVSRMKLCDATGRIRVGIALEEALLNALYHGNLEISSELLRESRANLVTGDQPSLIDQRRQTSPYRERKIQVDVRISPQEARFTIRDEGPGFDPALVPDCTDPANLERDSGRGLLLMRTFMDEVAFNDRGNQVTMVKRRDDSDG